MDCWVYNLQCHVSSYSIGSHKRTYHPLIVDILPLTLLLSGKAGHGLLELSLQPSTLFLKFGFRGFSGGHIQFQLVDLDLEHVILHLWFP